MRSLSIDKNREKGYIDFEKNLDKGVKHHQLARRQAQKKKDLVPLRPQAE